MYAIKPIIVNDSKVPEYFENKFMNNTVYGIMLFPFIFVSPRKKINENSTYTYDQIIMHETIHFYQCIETFFIGFYFIYAFEFLCNLLKHWDLWNAYLSVRFEVEAYSNMTTEKYLQKRDWYDWTSYMLFPDDTYNIEDLIYLHQLYPDDEKKIVIESKPPSDEQSEEEQVVEEEEQVVEEDEPVVEEKEPVVEEEEPVVEEDEPVVEEEEQVVEEDEPVVEEEEPVVEEEEPVVEEEHVVEEEEPVIEIPTNSNDVFNTQNENIDEEVSVSINRSLRNRSRKTQISMD